MKGSRVAGFFLFLLLSASIATPDSESSAPPTDRYPAIMQSIQTKDFETAFREIEPLRREFPDNPELLLFEIAALEGSGDFIRCASLAERFVEDHPDSINLDQAYHLLGSARIALGEREMGEEALRKAREVTDDPTLVERVDRLLGAEPDPRPRIGISLGGEPPAEEEEIKKYAEVSRRILVRAIRDYVEQHGEPPGSLDRLLDGAPPILVRLPWNPRSAEGRFSYRKTADGYELSNPSGD